MRFFMGVLGFCIYGGYSLWYRSTYLGNLAFYRLAQTDPGFWGEWARALLEGPLRPLFSSFEIMKAAPERLSPEKIQELASDPSLQGYGDEDFTKGGESLKTQQRGLVLPLLCQVLGTLPPGSTVLEIGTGNGDVVAYVAQRFPSLRCVGVDFSIANARRKHPHVDFLPGYALEILEQRRILPTLMFASSTFVLFTPAELRSYLKEMWRRDVRHIVLSEPGWGGGEQEESPISWHMENACWHHSWKGYLAEAGYQMRSFACAPYQHPVSLRPDLRVCLLHAEREKP